MKRVFKLGIGMLLIAAIVMSCGDRQDQVHTVKSNDRQELLLWSYYETKSQASGLDNLVEAFNNSQEEYILTWEYVPMTEFDKKISRAYTEQELPDLVIIDNPDMKKFIQLDVFEDITEYADDLELDSAYYEQAINTIKYNNEYYGVPFNSNNVCLIYRTDLFEEAGVTPPKTWDEFVDTAAIMTDDDTYGFLMSAMDSEQGAFQLLTWVMAASDSENKISQSAVEESYELLSGLIEDGYMPADCLDYSQTDVARRFIQGDIAMMENGPWVYPMLDEAGIEYSLAPMPQNNRQAVILGGENLGIIKGKNVEGAVSFINYAMTSGATEDFCRTANLLPSRISAAQTIIEENPNLEIIDDQMKYAIVRTDIEGYSSISQQLTTNFLKVVTGDMSVSEAAKETIK